MSRAGRWSLILLCTGLAVFGVLQPDQSRRFGATSFGAVPVGFGALHDTLHALDVAAERSYAAPEALPTGATVWWIEPDGLCADTALGPPREAELIGFRGGAEWIAGGGTAVVFPRRDAVCAAIAAIALPARVVPEAEHGDAAQRRRQRERESQPTSQVVAGPLTPVARRLEVPALATFADAGGLEVVARIGTRPFALERRIGAGRLVVIADAHFITNQWLDGGDAALLAVDLVRAYGTPRFDERLHGLRRESHPLRYLLRSPALAALLGLLVLGLLFVWRGQLMPARTLADAPANAPTLAAFVDSMAQLYAGTGDHASVLERYRALTAARLRRHFALPSEKPLATLLERLRVGRRGRPADLARLTDSAPVRGPAELDAAVRGLDALVRDVVR